MAVILLIIVGIATVLLFVTFVTLTISTSSPGGKYSGILFVISLAVLIFVIIGIIGFILTVNISFCPEFFI